MKSFRFPLLLNMSIARIVSIALGFALLVSVPLRAEEGRLYPREVFVGDAAEFAFQYPPLESVLDEGVTIRVGAEDLPVSYDLDLLSVSVQKSGGSVSVSVSFIPWTSGTLSIPAFAVKGVMVSPPSVNIASIVEITGKTSLENARSPLLVPGTTWLLYGLIGVILLVIALFAFLLFRLRSLLFNAGDKFQVRKRTRILERSLKTLERKSGSYDNALWYASYARIVRGYLGACLAGDFNAYLPLTGTEISSFAKGYLSDRIASLFSDLDTIRFGGDNHDAGLDVGDRDGFLRRARDLSADIESELLEASTLASEGKGEANAGV